MQQMNISGKIFDPRTAAVEIPRPWTEPASAVFPKMQKIPSFRH
jgi:hypothetical protein